MFRSIEVPASVSFDQTKGNRDSLDCWSDVARGRDRHDGDRGGRSGGAAGCLAATEDGPGPGTSRSSSKRRSVVRVGIVGGGIGGLSAAIALDATGHDVTVFEAYPEPTPGAGGAFLNIAPNGMHALHSLSLREAVAAAGFGSSGITFHNHNQRTIGRLDASDHEHRFGSANVMIRRADLHRCLLDAVRRTGAPVEFDHRVASIDERTGWVEVMFVDQRAQRFDLLIGADGVHSTVRSHVDETSALRFLGLVDVGGFAPLRPAGVEPGRQHMVFGRSAFFGYFVTPTGETWWFSNQPSDTRPDRDTLLHATGEDWRDRLAALHCQDPPAISEILGASHDPVGAWPITELEPLARWRTERVVLIGDAAHATSPSAGQGASLAIEDAVWLADHLRGDANLSTALSDFEESRRPRVQRLVADARRNSSHKTPGPVGRWFRDLLLPAFLKLGAGAAERAYDHRPPVLVADRTQSP